MWNSFSGRIPACHAGDESSILLFHTNRIAHTLVQSISRGNEKWKEAILFNAVIAQSVEQCLDKAEVLSSSLGSGTIELPIL